MSLPKRHRSGSLGEAIVVEILEGVSPLQLRQMHPARDARHFLQAVSDSRDFLRVGQPWVDRIQDTVQAEYFLDSYALQAEMDNGGLWGIFIESKFCGAVIVQWIQDENRSTSLGYWLVQSSQGQSIAFQAVNVLLKYLFYSKNIYRVELSIATNNTRSVRLAERLGFRLEGVRRSAEIHNGEFLDIGCWGMLAPEFGS